MASGPSASSPLSCLPVLSLITEDHKLHLSGHELTTFPTDLLLPLSSSSSSTTTTSSSQWAALQSLEVLDLSCNQLSNLPADLSHLSSLHTLNLSDNHLSSLADTVLPSSLTTLVLSGNRFTDLPLDALLRSCQNLTTLSLSGNKLASLPADLARLDSLVHLQLGSNLLTGLPRDLLFPPELQTLYLGGNLLTELPETVGHLPKLKLLSVHDNLLTRLPKSMVQLAELEVLNVHRNKLSLLPVEIIALRKLRQLSVRQNPLVTNFATSHHHHLPTLQELAGRVVKKHKLDEDAAAAGLLLPEGVRQFLDGSHQCLGCGGTYFGESGISSVEFVDLCGSFRVPFLQYICSAKCQEDGKLGGKGKSSATSAQTQISRITKLARLRKILLDKYAPSLSSPLEVIAREFALQEEEGEDLV